MSAGVGRDEGSSLVEFVIVVVCLMVPLAYAFAAVVTVHSAVFASTQAAREAGRAFAQSSTAAEGLRRANSAAKIAFADQGVAYPADALSISCPTGACLTPGSVVDVEVAWTVRLPWIPDVLAPERMSVPVSALHRVPIDDYRSSQAA